MTCHISLLIFPSVSIFLSYIFTRPYIHVIQSVGQGFHEVETGNFETRLEFWKRAPEEIKDIEFGFNEMVENLDNLINQVKQALLEQKNAELSALEAQIDPHFLYNTLDSINWKAIENEQYDISSMLVALANILRYTVDNAGGTSTLAQELGCR
jgi:two-component system, sensor histidine kinase YesM